VFLSDIIASGIQQEQNSENTDVDEPFSPSTKETFDLDSTSPQTFSAMSDSDRPHGAVSAEAAAVDDAAEVDLVDSAVDSAESATGLLLQSHDFTTAVHEPTKPQQADTGGDADVAAELTESQYHAAVDEKSSQEHLQSDQDAVGDETLDVVATCDESRPSEGSLHLESAGEQEADAGGSADKDFQLPSADLAALDADATCRVTADTESPDVDQDRHSRTLDDPTDWQSREAKRDTEDVEEAVTEEEQEQEKELLYQDEVITVEKQQVDDDTAEEQDDEQQKKCDEVVPQISISVCSSVNAEDEDDLANIEDTSAAASAFEEDSSYKDVVEESHDVPEISADTATCSAAEVLRTVHDEEAGQMTGYHSEEDATDRQAVAAAESLLLIESSHVETETKEEPEITEPTTPEVERNLSQYDPEREKETHVVTVSAVVHEKQERKELTDSLAEAQQLHDTKLLCSSTESMVSSTASDWTVIDTREESQAGDSFSAAVTTQRDATDARHHHVDEPFTAMASLAQTEPAVSQATSRDVFEARDEVYLGGLESTEDEDEEEVDTVEDYLTATVTPTVDLLVMSTALESIMEEEERTSSSQKTTSSSEKLEHEVSDSGSKLVGSSPDVQHAAESPTFHAAGKFTGEKTSDRDDASVTSSLAEFERLEKELQEKGSSESFSGGKGSSESAGAAAAPPESPQHKSSTSLSSSLAEFERIEHDIIGQSGSLELITIERRSHHTDSSSFSELERIEEMERNGTAAAEEQVRSSSGSLAEFEYIEQQLRLNEELESEALKVASLLEKGQASSAEKSPEVGSSQSDVRLSKEQIPESVGSVSAEELAQPAASASTDAQYPHYQDIVHIIREASKNVQTFQFGDHETSQISKTVSSTDDGVTRLRQEETTSESSFAETSEVTTTLSSTVTEVSTSTYSVSMTEHQVVVERSDEVRSSIEQRAESATSRQDVGIKSEPKESFPSTAADAQTSERELTDAVAGSDALSRTVGEPTEQQADVDVMVLSADSLAEDDVMQLSTGSLQPDMTTSTDSLELADVHGSSASSATTLLALEDPRAVMDRSSDSLESDSREPSGEWVTVYDADQERHEVGCGLTALSTQIRSYRVFKTPVKLAFSALALLAWRRKDIRPVKN